MSYLWKTFSQEFDDWSVNFIFDYFLSRSRSLLKVNYALSSTTFLVVLRRSERKKLLMILVELIDFRSIFREAIKERLSAKPFQMPRQKSIVWRQSVINRTKFVKGRRDKNTRKKKLKATNIFRGSLDGANLLNNFLSFCSFFNYSIHSFTAQHPFALYCAQEPRAVMIHFNKLI